MRHAHAPARRMVPWLLLPAALFFFCTRNPTGPEIRPGIPEDLGDGWAVSTPSDQGMDYELLAEGSSQMRNGYHGDVHSFLVARNGAIIFEAYYRGAGAAQLHRCYSVTKSVTSALMGIIRGQGLIGSLDGTLTEFLPEYAGIIDADADKRTISLRHVLTMTAGLEFDEHSYPYTDNRNSWRQMHQSMDWVEWTLTRPIVSAPGTTFQYSSACTILLAQILKNISGRDAESLAEEYLFGPLGIGSYTWEHKNNDPADIPDTGGGLFLRSRDMLKFGQMYLDGGLWEGSQIVPEAWVAESTGPQVWLGEVEYYGYQWWGLKAMGQTDTGQTIEFNIPYAAGYAGQYIVLLPIADLVVVFTASETDGGFNFIDILNRYVGPAVLDL